MTTLAKLAKQLRTIIAEQYQESNYIFKIQLKKDSTAVSVLTITLTNVHTSGTVKLWLDYIDSMGKYILRLHYHRGTMRFDDSLRSITLDECEKYPNDLLERAIKEFSKTY